MALTYHEEENIKNFKKTENILKSLPDFVKEFFIAINLKTSSRTRLNYAYDLKLFFNYLAENHPDFEGKCISDIKASDLESISASDLDYFIDYTTYYEKSFNSAKKKEYKLGRENHETGKKRKIAAIRSLYKYLYKKEKIKSNPTTLLETPKIHEKNITVLEPDELAILLDEVENGSSLTERQKKFHEKTAVRDLALVTLLAGTGIRISECIGLNISDINFDNNSFKIVRKGGNESLLYFGDEVREALEKLVEERKKKPVPNEDALFLSSQKRRLSARSAQNIVKKYSSACGIIKTISPHKLRSTFGTNLYNETGDIYLVADVLGHADVNTTKRHYARIKEERRKIAAKVTKLRKD